MKPLTRAFRKLSAAGSSDPPDLKQHQGAASSAQSDRSSATGTGEGSRYGLAEWVAGKSPTVDIIFIHGLNGHREKTWTSADGILWPRELLPEVVPNARIIGFGYDSRTHSSHGGLSAQTIHGHGTTILQALSLYRRRTKTPRRAIIFLAHSLGGLVLKNALINANLARKDHIEHYRAIFLSTCGIMFFGTPHQGGNGVAFGRLIANIASMAMQTRPDILANLAKDSDWLEQQTDHFKYIADQFETKFCYETVPSTILGVSKLVVDKSSAIIPGQPNAESIEMHKDHKGMVKLGDANDGDFYAISSHLLLMCEDAPERIRKRWQEAAGSGNDVTTAHGQRRSSQPIRDDCYLAMQLGYRMNPSFTGRQRPLEQLHGHLSRETSNAADSRIVIVIGTGGVGKTQLVRQYAYAYKPHYSSVSWINSNSLETTYASFHELAQRLISHYASQNKDAVPPYDHLAQYLEMPGLINGDGEVVFNQSTRNSVVQAVKSWFFAQGDSRWLLIFDNADDLETFNVSDFFPQTGQGSIIITSRRPECSHWGEELHLGVFEEDESIELLRSSCKLKQRFDTQELEYAKNIVCRLGHLPLAIDQAGAFIHTTRVSLSSYLSLLHRDKIRDAMSYKPPAAVWEYSESVFSTWELSFSEIIQRNGDSAELLSLCSFYSSENISQDMLELGLNAVSPEVAAVNILLVPLLSFSLITRNVSRSETFSIHLLVHDWARERLSLAKKTSMAEKAFSLICATLRVDEIWTTGVRSLDNWVYERNIMPHIDISLSWLTQLVQKDRELVNHIEELMRVANVYFYAGRYEDSESLYLLVLESTEKMLGPVHPDTLNALQGLATVNRFQGKWDACELGYQRVLSVREAKNPDHLDTLATVQSMGVLYRHKGMLQKSIELYQWALLGKDNDGKGIEAQKGPTHPVTIHTILGYAIVLQFQGRFAEAFPLYERVYQTRKISLGTRHPDTLTAMHNMADITWSLNDLEGAEQLFTEALAARETCLGLEHPDTLRTAMHLANVYRDTGRFEEAEKQYARVLIRREVCLGFEHSDTLSTVQHIAVSYRLQGRLDEAQLYYERALRGRERDKKLGRFHLDTVRSVEGLAMIAEQLGDHVEAKCRYAEVLKEFEAQMAPDCPDVRRALENMMRISKKTGQCDEAFVT